jgi:hypothetical protein
VQILSSFEPKEAGEEAFPFLKGILVFHRFDDRVMHLERGEKRSSGDLRQALTTIRSTTADRAD